MRASELDLLVVPPAPALAVRAKPFEEAPVDEGRGHHTSFGRREVLAGCQTPFPPLGEGRFTIISASGGRRSGVSERGPRPA